ncbi:substrate-binding domain-containing protein [Fusibacter tunisiensis]|uniref:DNA-binding LacI/PurR family transcriptional regulator n=1 Tax=Fusibacter tunisiensis TaxID=1008308 RepID=A0ABS2MT55_9FIRM|nr:DNA-binding LacI/PurR family transcriptional regulator [Fusibacter tunisiensis]
MVTIYDIAKACGCSSATVSKALNNYPDVNIKTKEKIKKKAKELGFVPNLQARALSTKRTWNIGVLFEDKSNSGLTHYYFSQVLQAVKEQAEEKGYDITFISKNLGGVDMSYLEHCNRRNIDGVVIACIDFKDNQVQELMASKIPVVVIDYDSEFVSAIMSDNVRGLYELTSYLIALGHRDIVYAYGHEVYVTEERIRGFKKALDEAGIPFTEDMLVKSRYSEKQANIDAVEEILKREKLPTAVLFPDDYAAIWGINAFRNHGVKIPEDISVAGFDGVEIGEMIFPRLTTIKQNTVRLGKEASLKCIQLLESKSKDNTKITVGIELIPGGTAMPPKTQM